MQTAQTMRRPSLSATTIVMLAAVLIAFVLGGFGGYAVKAVTSPGSVASRAPPSKGVRSTWPDCREQM